jgi:hypothetical protein
VDQSGADLACGGEAFRGPVNLALIGIRPQGASFIPKTAQERSKLLLISHMTILTASHIARMGAAGEMVLRLLREAWMARQANAFLSRRLKF